NGPPSNADRSVSIDWIQGYGVACRRAQKLEEDTSMSRIFNHRPSPALVVALLALFVALGSGAYAATQINGNNLKDRSVAGKKLKRNTVTGTELKEATLGKVPIASRADLAGKLAVPEGWHEVGAAGEPIFQHSW